MPMPMPTALQVDVKGPGLWRIFERQRRAGDSWRWALHVFEGRGEPDCSIRKHGRQRPVLLLLRPILAPPGPDRSSATAHNPAADHPAANYPATHRSAANDPACHASASVHSGPDPLHVPLSLQWRYVLRRERLL